jgi:outer membrane protein insertion porin family
MKFYYYYKTFFILIVSLLLSISNSLAENLKDIKINGNVRITDETIITFLPVKINEQITSDKINTILKSLYETDFFKNVVIDFKNNELVINVEENPIIQNILYNGIKSNSLKQEITKGLKLINRSSFIETYLEQDISSMKNNLKQRSYFFSEIDYNIEYLTDNRVNIKYNINLGNKAKIKKISFIGYYYAEISSSFAKLIDENEFELIFNINAKEKIFFGVSQLELPTDYKKENFNKLEKTLKELKDQPYSINSIQKITDEIELIALNEQYERIKVEIEENLQDNKLNLNFLITETDKLIVKRINIFGNNVTRESVVRNQFAIDEGDFFNEILLNKTINNLRSLNFFKTVNSEIVDDVNNDKVINISVEEKPTGEIGAAAGVGTSGGTVGFFVKENNYLGTGTGLEANVSLTEESITGLFSVTNPNYNDSDKLLATTIEFSETDKLKDFGYKTNKNGLSLFTQFEFLDDLKLGVGTSNYYEKIETDNTASALQKKQEGDYWDTFINLNVDYDKRNQSFQPSDGFRNIYKIGIPVISKTNTLTNLYQFTKYAELYDNNVTSFSFYAKTSTSLTNDDIKLTERNFLPSRRLRGFEAGKVGPKDGKDFIGGNFASSVNISTTIPSILEENQNVDFLLFLDAGNVWGVDYSSDIKDGNKIRSSVGIGVDWITAVGPLNFSLALPITKDDNDITETFRFNLGTTF